MHWRDNVFSRSYRPSNKYDCHAPLFLLFFPDEAESSKFCADFRQKSILSRNIL